ncbi:MAG: excinuclease ABC subunit UvrC [Coriobacteriales bacterium]|jgi:excinuclease ABC subunit C|nr:excinuclease ABC subunit UvrC [Coriobacteriales bacterium]
MDELADKQALPARADGSAPAAVPAAAPAVPATPVAPAPTSAAAAPAASPRPPSIREQLDAVPQLPGVYLWKGAEGQVLYVGKARQLRNRMRQYANLSDERAMIPRLMEQVATFEYLVTESEHESLILEKNLINQYNPPFNVDFKDDKSYPFIALTKGDLFPAIKYTREKPVSTTRYFGPYTDARAARTMVDVARRVIPLCQTSCVEWKRLKRRLEADSTHVPAGDKPCFDSHVGLGPGPCTGACSPEEYGENVRAIERFLAGHRREFLREMEREMCEAADALDFERAARTKFRIETIRSLDDRQHVQLSPTLSADVIGFFREETITGVHVLAVREGIVVISNEFVLDKGFDVPDDDLIDGFLVRYYEQATDIPREVVLAEASEDASVVEEWLTVRLASRHGARVRIVVPRRGERYELLQLAERNARHTLMRYKVRTRYDEERGNAALLQLESALALEQAPMRIECFDISTIHGRHSVASMVVFNAGSPDKSQYRRFKIRLDTGEANDFAMMTEVLGRRYAPERMADERFGARPDLLIVDGGKPQLTAALRQLEALGLDIPVAGLAKADEELFVPWDSEGPVVLPSGSPALYLVKQIRDEAHRFAITFHRELRGKAMTASVLDDVTGLGPKRKKLLLRAFGSFKKLREASVEEMTAIKGIPRDVAEEVHAVLHQKAAT